MKRKDRVYTQIVTSCSATMPLPIIQRKVKTESEVYTDGFKSYDGLVDAGYKKHYRVSHGTDEFASGKRHINGIENFWGMAKTRLVKFKGIHRKTFYLHLKKSEFKVQL